MRSLPIMLEEPSVQLVVVNCCICGTPFAMESQLNRNFRENHSMFFCPIGHQQSYKGKSDAERLREELTRRTEALLASQRATALAEKKTHCLEKRIKNGCCPCCKRPFINLQRHIATKHPGFAKTQTIGA